MWRIIVKIHSQPWIQKRLLAIQRVPSIYQQDKFDFSDM